MMLLELSSKYMKLKTQQMCAKTLGPTWEWLSACDDVDVPADTFELLRMMATTHQSDEENTINSELMDRQKHFLDTKAFIAISSSAIVKQERGFGLASSVDVDCTDDRWPSKRRDGERWRELLMSKGFGRGGGGGIFPSGRGGAGGIATGGAGMVVEVGT